MRAATAADHERVDAAFSAYDLSEQRSYGDFLAAQARATVPIERALATVPGLPQWRPRAEALAEDLAVLGRALPPPIGVSAPGGRAEAMGMLYVLEGSRLGGAIIVNRVPAALPRRFLAARHLHGEWRALLEQIDAAAGTTQAEWHDGIIEGARRGFAAYYDAARLMIG